MKVIHDPFGEECKIMFENAIIEKKPPVQITPSVSNSLSHPEDVAKHSSYLKQEELDMNSRDKDYYSSNLLNKHSHRDSDERDSNSLSKWSDDDKNMYKDKRHCKHRRVFNLISFTSGY